MTKYYAAHYISLIRYDEIQDRAKLNHVEKIFQFGIYFIVWMFLFVVLIV